jgi:hypothetical protein
MRAEYIKGERKRGNGNKDRGTKELSPVDFQRFFDM